MQDRDYKYNGYLLNLIPGGHIIFLPFVCQKCGRCCREIGIEQNYFDPYQIAEYLKIRVEEAVKKYLGELIGIEGDEIFYNINKPKKPCVFLESDKCKIYGVRPFACKSYPLFGDAYIGCPARQELRTQQKVLSRGYGFHSEIYRSDEKPPTHIKRSKRKKFVEKYCFAQPSLEAFNMFVQANNLDTDLK